MKIGLSVPPDFSPGKDWLYSNTGYVILGMLIEKITGNSYAEEIEKRIIEPLDLSNTFYQEIHPSSQERIMLVDM